MATLAKNLKDTNGNIILPKTRSEQVYRPDNTNVESTLSNLTTTVNNISTEIREVSNNGYYEVSHSKSGTIHTLSNLPDLTGFTIFHATFKATADYVVADTIDINGKSYICKLITQEEATDGLFKMGSIVTIDVDLNGDTCFFNYGGSFGGGTTNPPDPNTYQLSELITSTRDWSPPQDGWYRIFCVGKSGNGGNGGKGGNGNYSREHYGSGGGGGGGGGSGGVGIYEMYIKNVDVIPITISTSLSSFGEFTTATAGGNGGNGGNGNDGSTRTYRYGIFGAGGSVGVASGGNIANLDGFIGGNANGSGKSGETQAFLAENGGNDGGLANPGYANHNNAGCSGGGGARYATHNSEFSKYVMTTSQMRSNGYCGGIANASGVYNTSNQNNINFACGSFYNYNISSLLLTGGGWGGPGGGGGSDSGATSAQAGQPGKVGKEGCPGCIIIEKSIS